MSIVGKVWGFVISGYLYGWLVMIVFSSVYFKDELDFFE